MLIVKINGTDITDKVEQRSIKITEQLNNRSNTCSFTVLDHPVPESALIEIWEGSEMMVGTSGATLQIDDTFEYFQKYRVGDELRIPAGQPGAKKVVVQSINHTTKELTLTAPLGTTYPDGTKIGRLIFAGVSQKNPDDEIACGVFTYKVSATDWTKPFDAKNIVDTFEDQYPREIIGRMVHKFTAVDSFLEVSDAETTDRFKSSGVARPLATSTDCAYKAKSISTGATGAGTVSVRTMAGANIGVFDGSFLGALNDSTPGGWKSGTTSGITFENTGPDGGRCMKVTLSAGDYREIQTHQAGYFIGSAGYTVKPNTKYKIAGWMKVVGTGSMQYGARMGLLGNKTSGVWENWTPAVLIANGGWTYYEAEFTSPVDATYAHSACNFYNHGSSTFTGSVYFDEFTITEVVDASTKTHLRTWTKIGLSQLSKLSAPKVRAKTTENDYFEWTNPIQVEDCWSYDSFEFSSATQVGTPLQNSISSVELLWTASTTIPQDGILIDQISLTSGGFTIRNVMRGTTKYADARAQFKKPTVMMEDLAKIQKLLWYIDYEKDVHFFDREAYICPMEVLDSGLVYDDLSIGMDTTQLRNRQVVRGGEAIDGSLYIQTEVTDGKMESWRLDYKPKDLQIDISTNGGTTWIQKTVGVKNLHAPADYEYLFDFNEKVVERASDGILANGTLIRRTYYPYRPIRVQVEDSASIIKVKSLLGGDGIYDGPVINDTSIRSFEDARARAKAELEIYANAIISSSWTSEQDGWRAGQIVHIKDSNRAFNEDLVIQKVDRTQKTNGRWQYTVSAGTSMFGLTEFFQLLLKRSDKMMIDVSELVDVVKTIDEVIVVSDPWIFKKKSRPWYAHTYTGQYNISLTGTEGGTANDAYADYCEAA